MTLSFGVGPILAFQVDPLPRSLILGTTNEFIYLFDFFSLLPGTHYKESKAYSQQTLALSILLTALLALVAGFTVGLLVSRRCHQQKQLHLAEIYDKTLNFTK